jgi:hypothetical protein
MIAAPVAGSAQELLGDLGHSGAFRFALPPNVAAFQEPRDFSTDPSYSILGLDASDGARTASPDRT